MNRRTFLRALGFVAVAPAIVRVASIMPVRAVPEMELQWVCDIVKDMPDGTQMLTFRSIMARKCSPIEWAPLTLDAERQARTLTWSSDIQFAS